MDWWEGAVAKPDRMDEVGLRVLSYDFSEDLRHSSKLLTSLFTNKMQENFRSADNGRG